MATILIVDRSAERRRHFAAPLEDQGHRLLEASDAADALGLIRSERPHLIIADTEVPKIDGFEMIHHLMSDHDSAQTRLILYSGGDFQRDAIALTQSVEVPAVLLKPSQPEEVVRMVDLALSQTGDLAEPVKPARRRIGRRHLRQSPIGRSQVDEELLSLRSENEHLKAELRGGAEEKFRQLAEHIGQVFWMTDPAQSQVIFVSRAYEKVWGRTRESLYVSPRSWTEAIHRVDRDRVVEAAAKMQTATEYEQIYRIVRPDGSVRWIRDRAFPVYDTGGKLIRMAGIAEDVTDLRHAEEELRRYADRLEAMSEIDHAILTARSTQEIAQAVVSRIRRLIHCQRASVVTFDFEAGQASFVAVSVDGESRWPANSCLPIEEFGDIEDLRLGKVRLIDDLLARSNRPLFLQALLEVGTRSAIFLPIAPQNKLIGLFNLYETQLAAFNQEDVEVAREIAERFAVTLQGIRLFEQIRGGQERLQVLSRQLLESQEDERRRISRELHDEIGQALTVTKVSLEALKQTAHDLASAAERTMATVENTVGQVRNMSFDLRPPMLDDLGLAAALRCYLDRQAQCAGFAIDFEVDPITEGVSPETETACFRVAQEAMTNIIRHARPQQVRVELRQHEKELQLLVRDDGVSFDLAAARARAVRGESLGLLGMEERVTLLGGRIEIESAPDHGTDIRASFPL